MTTTDITAGKDIGVNVSGIEKELASLWRQASKDKQVTRACSWNLVVHTGDTDAGFDACKGVIDEAVRHVPSRALVLKPRPNASTAGAAEIEAWVSANCQIAPGGGKLLCTEEITVEARGKAGLEHVPGLIRALQVPDVPTALWWAGAPPTDSSAVRILLAGVDRLVFDSKNLVDDNGLSKLAHVGGLLDGLLLCDLNWLRTGSLRSVIASVFDAPIGAAPLSQLKRVRIEVRPGGLPSAKLLVGWLASRLAWGSPERVERGQHGWRVPVRDASVRVDIDVAPAKASPGASAAPTRDSGVAQVALETTGGERFVWTAGADATVEVSTSSGARTALAHEPPLHQLLVAALGSRGRDRLYAVALHRAVELDR